MSAYGSTTREGTDAELTAFDGHPDECDCWDADAESRVGPASGTGLTPRTRTPAWSGRETSSPLQRQGDAAVNGQSGEPSKQRVELFDREPVDRAPFHVAIVVRVQISYLLDIPRGLLFDVDRQV